MLFCSRTFRSVIIGATCFFVLPDNLVRCDEPVIKWPFCELETEGLKPRPIVDAISKFNQQSQSHPVGVKQEPITVEEVILAIDDALTSKRVSEKVKVVLREIRESKTLPGNAYFRRFSRFNDSQRMRGVWWVRLMIEDADTAMFSVSIRQDYLWSRPYTQMERQQNAADGLMLINRFVSYYESPPVDSPQVPLPSKLTKALLESVNAAIESKDVDQFKELFVWHKATKKTREFVTSELTTITNATVHSVSLRQQNLRGNLLHWSAFQHYQPNAPIVGFVDIVYTPAGDALGRMATLSLEVGKADSGLWFVNYIAGDRGQLPKRLAGLSSRSASEPNWGNTLYTYSNTTNPGPLLSAHLTNEEISEWNPGLAASLPTDAQLVGNDIKLQREKETSQRLKALFEKLNIGPRLQISSHARDLPELYKPREGEPSRFTRRDGIFSEYYDVGIKHDPKGEVIWIKYLPKARHFYIEHRPDWSDPYSDRVFGPYDGNVLALLPELEQSWLVKIREGDSNVIRTLHRMVELKDIDLASRVLALIDKSMYWEPDEIRKKHALYKDLQSLLTRDEPLFRSVPDQRRLEAVKKRFDMFSVEVEKRRMAFPAEDYKTENESLVVPEEIGKELWGQPKDGVRCALVPKTTSFLMGEAFDATLVIENVGDTSVKLCLMNNPGSYPSITLDGQSVMINTMLMGGFHFQRLDRYSVKPGKRIAVGTMRIRLEKTDEVAARPIFHEGQHTAVPFSKSTIELDRRYRIGTSVWSGEMDLWRNVDGEARIYHPAKGEWTGRIETPGFEIKLEPR